MNIKKHKAFSERIDKYQDKAGNEMSKAMMDKVQHLFTTTNDLTTLIGRIKLCRSIVVDSGKGKMLNWYKKSYKLGKKYAR